MVEFGPPNVDAVMARLKPFQQRTVEHVFRHLYLEPGGSKRFLVSDEVGLGKTLVAKGVIAKAIEHLWPRLAEIGRIDVVYICSNGQIARQNLSKLDVMGDDSAIHASRATMLPVKLHGLRGRAVNFISFTPSTSFDLRSSMGMWEERVVLYWMLKEAWGFDDAAGPMNIFQGGVSFEGTGWFRGKLAQFPDSNTIDEGLQEKFVATLEEKRRQDRELRGDDIRVEFDRLCSRFSRAKPQILETDQKDRAKFLGSLRRAVAESSIKALEPDLVILDEFQRFKNLLGAEDEAGQLAKELLEYSDEQTDVRVLLLSATPYKMYTLHAEADTDDHYGDFLHTLGFLLNDEAEKAQVANLLQDFRREVYRAGVTGPEALGRIKLEIERLLSPVMARTERLAATTDGSGMVRQARLDLPQLSVSELAAYPVMDRLSTLLDAGGVMEYWKSSPYLLNLMQGYKIKNQLRRRLESEDLDEDLLTALVSANGSMLSWKDIEEYRQIDPQNVRLKALMQETLDKGWWRLLWVPASLPYYRPEGPFQDVEPGSVTKRLVFSGWAVVPRTISAVLSYEAERQQFSVFENEPKNTAAARKKRTPLLQVAFSDGRLTGLPLFCLMYPSIVLSRLGNVAALSWVLGSDELPSREEIIESVRARLERPVAKLTARYGGTDGPEDEAWYWAMPFLLDLEAYPETAEEWLSQTDLANRWSGGETGTEPGESQTRWEQHVEKARELLADPSQLGLPPADLLDLMAEVAVAGPATCALRALAKIGGSLRYTADWEVRNAAAAVGWAFRSLFNRPSVTAMVRGSYRHHDKPYWRQVLRYCSDGVLQAVLDEFAHVLRDEWSGGDRTPGSIARDAVEVITTAVSMRTASFMVDDISVKNGAVNVVPRSMRVSFAMPFGDQRDESQREGVRQEQVRKAFNSPFRPFVLATTSVGQEGLDFHPYCHAVVHWNLPSNPVDLEQREGRVHRYKCHAVRKNIAREYDRRVDATQAVDLWEEMFKLAAEEHGAGYDGMVPFWVFDPKDGFYIERHVPALPLSRDHQRYEDLRRALAVYRMVFGQPRQEDLLAYLLERVGREQLDALRPYLQIDLRPRVPEGER